MKIRSVGAELLHADGQTDMTELTVVSRKYVDASEKCVSVTLVCIQKALIASYRLYGVAQVT